MSESAVDEVELGPIDYLVVEYPEGKMSGEALPHLLDLVAKGTIRMIDVALLTKSSGDGTFEIVRPADLVAAGAPEFAMLEGVATGLLSDDDLRQVSDIMADDSSAVVFVYENAWAAPMATALRRAGGQLISNGRIPVQSIIEALEASASETVESI